MSGIVSEAQFVWSHLRKISLNKVLYGNRMLYKLIEQSHDFQFRKDEATIIIIALFRS